MLPLAYFVGAKWDAGGLWHEIWVTICSAPAWLQAALLAGQDVAEQCGPDHGPLVRKDEGFEQRPCLKQFRKKRIFRVREELGWYLFHIPLLSQCQSYNCSNHRRYLFFNKSFFFSLSHPTFLPLLLGSSNEIIALWPQRLLPGINITVNSTSYNLTVESNKCMEGIQQKLWMTRQNILVNS